MTDRRPRPTLIGVVQLPDSASPARRSKARLTIALRAMEEGYALIETFEVAGCPDRDARVYEIIEDLAARVDAHALLISGDVDRARLDRIAEWVRILVHQMERR